MNGLKSYTTYSFFMAYHNSRFLESAKYGTYHCDHLTSSWLNSENTGAQASVRWWVAVSSCSLPPHFMLIRETLVEVQGRNQVKEKQIKLKEF